MAANVVLATAKIFAGAIGHSYVLIADGIESALDIGGSAIIWGGLKFAARPADETHPYGHGKAEPVAAIIVSLGVLAAALVIAARSVHEIFQPHHAPEPFTLVVLVVVVAIKELLFRMVNRLGRNANSTAIQTDAWHHRTDAFTSIAAFIGISIALLGGPRWQSADAWAALFACVLIGANGWRLFYPALREVLDTAPRGEIVEQVRTTAAQVRGGTRDRQMFRAQNGPRVLRRSPYRRGRKHDGPRWARSGARRERRDQARPSRNCRCPRTHRTRVVPPSRVSVTPPPMSGEKFTLSRRR
jgi:cation diffusion facilitator family transporter